MKRLLLNNHEFEILRRITQRLTSNTSWIGQQFHEGASLNEYRTMCGIGRKLEETA